MTRQSSGGTSSFTAPENGGMNSFRQKSKPTYFLVASSPAYANGQSTFSAAFVFQLNTPSTLCFPPSRIHPDGIALSK